MNTELRKRLEEAKERYHYKSQDKIFFEGYKEAVNIATEWMREHLGWYVNSFTLSKFETDMNKLWEEKK